MADPQQQNGSPRRSAIALGVIVLLLIVGWALVHELYANGQLQDCLLSGRTNCAPIQAPGR